MKSKCLRENPALFSAGIEISAEKYGEGKSQDTRTHIPDLPNKSTLSVCGRLKKLMSKVGILDTDDVPELDEIKRVVESWYGEKSKEVDLINEMIEYAADYRPYVHKVLRQQRWRPGLPGRIDNLFEAS